MAKKKKRNPGALAEARSGDSTTKTPSKFAAKPPTILGIPKNRLPLLIIFVVITFGGSFAWYKIANGLSVKQLSYQKIAEYDHDVGAFTQGLVYDGKYLYESTGQRGESDIRKVDLETGKVLQESPLGDQYFGEGLTLMNDKFYQITWQENTGFVYDRDFNKIEEFSYDGEGWGLTHDGTHLIMSDGTPTLRYLDPKTFKVVKRVTVRYGSSRQYNINELEYAGNGHIYANVLEKQYILEINAKTGAVISRIDCRGLMPKEMRVGVLNGIALKKNGNLLVTGKNWPKLYEIKIIERQEK